jgi:transcriptional regulator PpsR
LLFQVASEAVLIVDASNRKVLEANPAAGRLLGEGNKRLVGHLFPDGFDEASTVALHGLLGAVGATGRTNQVTVRSADGAREFAVSASLFREERASFFLIRLSAADANQLAGPPTQQSKVLEIVASAPEGFVVTDLDGRVLFTNRAFLDLVQLATEEQARNESLERWLGRPGVDFNLLTAQLREHGSLRLFATQLRGEYGSNSDVEICAVSVTDGEEPCLGFTIRDVGQRVTFDRQISGDKPRSMAQLTELVGRVPLKDLVRESTDMIEKLCIEAALEITGDNRASAAELVCQAAPLWLGRIDSHGRRTDRISVDVKETHGPSGLTRACFGLPNPLRGSGAAQAHYLVSSHVGLRLWRGFLGRGGARALAAGPCRSGALRTALVRHQSGRQ